MRFPFGFGGGGSKKGGAASDAMRNKMSGGAASQDFSKRLKDMVDSTVGEYTSAKQRSAQARGGKAEPQELSKNTKTMLEILARQKLQKQMKKEKQQEDALKRAEKNKKQAADTAKKQLQYQNDMKAKQLADLQSASSQTPARDYFFGYTDET